MPKSSPEKLAQALRANLKRRKQAAVSKVSQPPPDPAPKPPKKSA
jgi:hypothetical protein